MSGTVRRGVDTGLKARKPVRYVPFSPRPYGIIGRVGSVYYVR